jgi:hypothetical protein
MMQRDASRAKMVGAGRMTVTTRADIGARFEARPKAWVWGCVQTCDDACRVSDNDLDWEFALIPRPAHPASIV